MPLQIRKLSAEETAATFSRTEAQDLSAYLAALRGLEPGDVLVVAETGLSSRAIKRRFGAAAHQLALALRWAATPLDEGLVLQVRTKLSAQETRRRGRPPRSRT